MGRAPKSQRRRFGKGEVLIPPEPAPVQAISGCLEALQSIWRQEGSLAALWQDWPKLAGDPLSSHCRPLALRSGMLTVGASHPQWRQALLYSKPQLLAAIRAAVTPPLSAPPCLGAGSVFRAAPCWRSDPHRQVLRTRGSRSRATVTWWTALPSNTALIIPHISRVVYCEGRIRSLVPYSSYTLFM